MTPAVRNVVAPGAPAAWRPERAEEHLVGLLAPASFEAEQYRTLRHAVEHARRTHTAIAGPTAIGSAGGTGPASGSRR